MLKSLRVACFGFVPSFFAFGKSRCETAHAVLHFGTGKSKLQLSGFSRIGFLQVSPYLFGKGRIDSFTVIRIASWWCRLFSWEFAIKISNLETTDLHMLTHASLRTQESNFGSKYVKYFKIIWQTSGHRKVMFMEGEFTRTYMYVKPQEKIPDDYLRYGSLHDSKRLGTRI